MILNYSQEIKKINGVFYTPNFLSSYLARKVFDYWQKNNLPKKIQTILDPACGDSALLRAFGDIFLSENFTKCQFIGVDTDINAIVSSTNKFSLDENLKKSDFKFFNTDGLFPNDAANTPQAWTNFKQQIDCQKGFDIILSNPPWGADMSNYDAVVLNNSFSVAKGQFDICSLFVESIVNNLSETGIYGLILPDSLFNQEQWRVRSLLLKETSILSIVRLGEKIFPEVNRACVLVIGTQKKIKNNLIDCFRLNIGLKKQVLNNSLLLEEIEKELVYQLPQQRFLQNAGFLFDIDLKENEENIIQKLENSASKVKEFVENSRGAEISKKGITCKCANCAQWLPFPKSVKPICTHCRQSLDLTALEQENIIFNHNGQGNLKLKVGEDLYRYKSISKSWMNTLKEGINYKDLSLYEGDKILVRKTGIGITASMDYENAITNQVVYILKLKMQYQAKLTLEFVLAVLNSRAMTYFLLKKYGDTEWKSHPYMTQTMLVNLPFPTIDFENERHLKLIENVTTLVKEEVSSSNAKNISLKTDIAIEKIIASFFDLNEADYQQIFEALASAQQLIPIKRLLNCSYKDIFSTNGI
jgi:adenine-specific DNA-methyltransferase